MELFKKEREYDQFLDLGKLSKMIETYLKDDNWFVQIGNTEKEGKIIQARKGGILRDIIAADRALIIVLSKVPKGTKVEIGIGNWIQNIGVTIAESVLLSGLFLAIDIPELLWNEEIEIKVQKKIDEFVNIIKEEK